MASKVYVAISSTDLTGQTVPGDATATYASTFALVTTALADPTYGARDLVAPDVAQIYDLCNTITETDHMDFAGFTSTPSNSILLKAQEGTGHTGKPNTGVAINNNSFNKNRCYARDDVTVEGIEFVFTGKFGTNLFSSIKGTFKRCIVSSTDKACCAGEGTFISCLAFNSPLGFHRDAYAGVKYYNCLSLSCGKGFSGLDFGTDIAEFKNCASLDSTTEDFSILGTNWVGDRNASSDGTAIGTNPLINVVVTDALDNPLAFDPHLKAGSPLKDVGVDLSGVVIQDIDNQPWTVPYSIGCDQPGTFFVPITINCLTPDGLAIQGALVYCEAGVTGPLSQGTEIMKVLSDVNGIAFFNHPYGGAPQLIQNGRSRQGTLAPYYETGSFFGTIGTEGLTTNSIMAYDS